MIAPDGTFRYANQALGDLVGVAPATLVGERADGLSPDGRRESQSRRLARILADPADRVLGTVAPLHLERADGSVVVVDVGVTPLDDGALVVIVREHDPLPPARGSEPGDFQLDQAPFGVALVGLGDHDSGGGGLGHGRIIEVNHELAALAGRAETDLVGLPLADLAHPDDRIAVNDLLTRALAGHRARAELRLAPAESGTWVEVALSALTGRPGLGLARFEDITARRRVEAVLARSALHDPLTGLPTRSLAEDRLHQAMNRAERTGRQVAALFCDLDRFQSVNETYGHEAGDAVLRAVVDRLRTAVRPDDTLARLGGDELLVVVDEVADAEEALVVAARLQASLDRPIEWQGREVRCTLSIGIALSGDDHLGAEALIRNAGMAVHRAKQEKRPARAVYTNELGLRAAARLQIGDQLEAALSGDQFTVYAQPVVELATGRLAGAEALARWEHPSQGVLLPGAFLDLVEDAGLLTSLGRRLLDQALGALAGWRRHGSGLDLTLSFNLGSGQLQHARLVKDVLEGLDRHGLPGTALVIEVTEDTYGLAVASSVRALQELRGHGVRVALDDFGTGYSSLAHLRRFPVDVLKVDRSFVTDLAVDPVARAMARAVIDLAHALGLATVAEGIEEPAQRDVLVELGCPFGQGFLLGRPAPAERFPVARGGD